MAHPALVAVYRFGSSATGTARTDSDIDLALLGERPLSPLERFDLQERIAAALRRQVDLVDFAVSVHGDGEPVTTGVLLFEGQASERERFENFVYGRYARLNEERRGILERVAAEGTSGWTTSWSSPACRCAPETQGTTCHRLVTDAGSAT